MTDDLERRRLTVFFRLILAIPHLIWVTLWGIAAFVVSFVLWLAVLINGQAPTILHDFVAGYLRYATQVGGYLFLAASPYPGFRGSARLPDRHRDRPAGAPEPLDGILPPAARASRPDPGRGARRRHVLRLLGKLLEHGRRATSDRGRVSFTGTAAAAAFLAWFAILAKGRSPRGLRDLVAYALGYSAQAGGYLFLLTGRYPSSDPALAEDFAELPHHPVQMVVADDLGPPATDGLLPATPRDSPPHLAAALVRRRVSRGDRGLVRRAGHRPRPHRAPPLPLGLRALRDARGRIPLPDRRRFPGFTGREGSYGIDLAIAPPERQSRWKTLFRFFLAIPAFILASALGGVALIVAVLVWFFALVTGRTPEDFRNLGASCLRYSAQTYAYFLLVTPLPVRRARARAPAGRPGETSRPALVAAARVTTAPAAAGEDEPRTEVLPIVYHLRARPRCAACSACSVSARSSGPSQGALHVLAPPVPVLVDLFGTARARAPGQHPLLGCGVHGDPLRPERLRGSALGGAADRGVPPRRDRLRRRTRSSAASLPGHPLRPPRALRRRHAREASRHPDPSDPRGCRTAFVDDAPDEGCGSRTIHLGTISTVALRHQTRVPRKLAAPSSPSRPTARSCRRSGLPRRVSAHQRLLRCP